MKKIVSLIVIGFFGISLISCGSKSEQSDSDEIGSERLRPVKVDTLKSRNVKLEETYPATITAGQTAHIAPVQPGQIQRIHVEVGDEVRQGQVLIEMDPTQRNQTRVQYFDAKRDLQRMDSLIAYGSIAQQMYDKAKLQYEVLETTLKMLEENTVIRAPFDGVVTGKYFNDRENFTGVAPQIGVSAIVTIMQINELKVEINISERYFPIIRRGMRAELYSNIFPDEVFRGAVKTISPVIESATKTFTVEIAIPNTQKKLRPGMFARLRLDFGSADILSVPSHALLKQEGTNVRYIFVYEEGVARRITVIPGRRYDDIIEIQSDELKEGMLFITAGHTSLSDGDKITLD